MKISLIVPAYNEADYLTNFFKSLKYSKYPDYEIIVVNDQSEDETASIAEKFGAKVLTGKREGVGSARNIGLKHAKGEVIASLDADSTLCENWIDKVAKNFEQDEKLKALSGPSYYGGIYDLWSIATQWENNLTPITGFAYFGANNSAYKKAYLMESGGWAENINEEMDMSLRLFLKRAKIKYDWELKVKLSDRRFRKKGFFRTISYWLIDSAKTILKLEENRSDYSSWRKQL